MYMSYKIDLHEFDFFPKFKIMMRLTELHLMSENGVNPLSVSFCTFIGMPSS